MERKAKIGADALLIAGIVFSCVGALFLVIGIALSFSMNGKDAAVFLLAFGGIGLIFLVVGLIFLIVKIKKKLLCNRLLQSGNYIMAEISEVNVNYNVTINGRSPYVVECRYQDMAGNVHIFASRCLYFNPEPLLQSQMVKVYVEGDNYKHYYVDIDEILPKVIRH